MAEKSHPSTSVLHLFGGIDYDSCVKTIAALKKADADPQYKDIHLELCSGGGKLYPGFALYDQIKRTRKPVTVHAQGQCMSAAVMIMQAADKRIASKHTFFMMHPSGRTFGSSQPVPELLQKMENASKVDDLFAELTLKRATMSRDEYKAMTEPAYFFDAQRALDLGLIDSILA